MLVTCSECGKQISDKAKTCPNCGAPIGCGGVAVEVSGLKRTVALVFAIFLGWIGAHNRYLGYRARANIELVVFIISLVLTPFGIGAILLFVLWLWALIETLIVKTDSDGEKLEW